MASGKIKLSDWVLSTYNGQSYVRGTCESTGKSVTTNWFEGEDPFAQDLTTPLGVPVSLRTEG